MPILLPPNDQIVVQIPAEEFIGLQTDSARRRQTPPDLYSGVQNLTVLKVGETRYQLRNQISGRCYPHSTESVEFVVDGFGPAFVGIGPTAEDAEEDWREKVHSAFQQLIQMRPFEMDASDERNWSNLQSIIDVPHYRRTCPIVMRQVGRAEYVRTSIPKRIRWANNQIEHVSLDKMPAEFAALKPNQWFDAYVKRDPLTGDLLEVLTVKRINSLRIMSRDQQKGFFQRLSTNADDACGETGNPTDDQTNGDCR